MVDPRTPLVEGTLIAIGYDNVLPRQTPEKWNISVLFSLGAVLAFIACISSLVLLYLLLDSWRPGGVFQHWGIGGLSYGQITTSIYLKVFVCLSVLLFACSLARLLTYLLTYLLTCWNGHGGVSGTSMACTIHFGCNTDENDAAVCALLCAGLHL